MATLAAQLAGQTPAEAASHLDTVPPEASAAALRRVARESGEGAFPLLEALAGMGAHPPAQAAAIEALGEVPLQAAADLVERWTGEQAPKELRKAARRAVLRLAQRGIHPTPPPAAGETVPPAPRPEHVRRALMSAVDGEGTRLLYLLFDVPMSGAYLALAIVSQAQGLTRFETTESSTRRFERFVEEDARRFNFTPVEIPPLYARHLLAEAVAASRAAGHGLPQRYHSFRDLLPAPGEDEPVESPVYGEPDAAAVRYRPDALEESVQLLALPEFANWLPPAEQVVPLAREWEDAEGGTLALPPSAVAQKREATMAKLVTLVLGPGGPAGFRRRLEDNAYVLLRTGRAREGRRALAAALALDPPDLPTARVHPFVRSLAATALDEARAALAGERESATARAGLTSVADLIDAGDDEDEPGLTRTPSGIILPR